MRVNCPVICPLYFRKKWLSEAKLKARSEVSRQNIPNIIFGQTLRLTLSASPRSAIFSKILTQNA